MDKNDFSDIEDQIKDSVQNALNYIDFSGIRKSFDATAENTVNEVKNQMKNTSDYVGKRMQDFSKKQQMRKVNKENEIDLYINNKPKGKYKGAIYKYIGGTGSALFGISAFVIAVVSMFGIESSFIQRGMMISLSIVSAFFLGSLFVTYKGIGIRKRLERFKKYANCIREKKYCEIDELASLVNKKSKFVIKDLNKMMDMDMFREGHIDEDKKYFILSNKVYQEYLISIESYKNRKKDELEKEDLESYNSKTQEELIVETGKKYISEIRLANDVIEDSEMSEKLYKLENVVKEIFKTIEKNPKKLPEVKKFIDHYLPITLKLVNSYKELAMQSIETENIKKAKVEIEKSIDLINTAFENLYDGLFEEAAMDISSDISVLETLFNQDGLTNNDFKKDK